MKHRKKIQHIIVVIYIENSSNSDAKRFLFYNLCYIKEKILATCLRNQKHISMS